MWNWIKNLFSPPTKVDKALGKRDFGDWTLQTYEEVEEREGTTQKATTAEKKGRLLFDRRFDFRRLKNQI